MIDAFKVIGDIHKVGEQILFLNRPLAVGHSEHFATTYLELPRVRLHDSIMSKFLEAMFAALLTMNPLSSSASANVNLKNIFELRVNWAGEYYKSEEYNSAWKNACNTAFREIKSSASMSSYNKLRHKPQFYLPPAPDSPSSTLSPYVFGFLILKVSSTFFTCFTHS